MGSSICRTEEEVEDDEEDAISYFRGAAAAAAGKNAIAFVAHNRYVIIWSRSTSVVASPRLQLRWELCPPWVGLHHHHQHHRHHHHPCDVLSATLSLSLALSLPVSPSPWPIYLAMQEVEAAAGMGSRSGRMVSVTSSRRNNIDDANAKLFRCIDR